MRLGFIEIVAVTAAAIHFGLASCAFSQPRQVQQKASDVPFVIVDKGFNSGVRGRKLLAVKIEKEWQDLWQTHESIRTPPKRVPLVDFEREMIVVAFSGEKPSGGYGIEIVKIEQDTARRELRVTFREPRPPAGAMVTGALTQPYHIVKLKTTDLPVTFVPQQ